MLQQTQVATVLPYYRDWLRRFPDFERLAAAPESDVLHAWQGLGYYARARNLHATAKTVVNELGGQLPRQPDQMRSLPGLGRYTCNAVATFAFDQSVPIVEANTARLLARLTNLQLRIDSGAGQKQLWETAASLLPARNAAVYNSGLMDLGALVCTAAQPKCSICPVRAFCRAEKPATLPLKRPRAQLQQLVESHEFAINRGRVLLEQSSDRWRGMWILPRLAERPVSGRLLHRSSFPFTHHRVTLDVFAGDQARRSGLQRWIRLDELATIPLPSPHRRALHVLLQQTGQQRN